jgi:hypothetical protein
MAHTVEDLLNLTDAQLDELFANGTVGDMPNGSANGGERSLIYFALES